MVNSRYVKSKLSRKTMGLGGCELLYMCVQGSAPCRGEVSIWNPNKPRAKWERFAGDAGAETNVGIIGSSTRGWWFDWKVEERDARRGGSVVLYAWWWEKFGDGGQAKLTEHPQGADARQCIFGTNRRFGDPSCDRSAERNAGGTGYSAQSSMREQLGQVMMGRYYYY